MGTRADFYVGRGKAAEWLGSIAWDGHPGSIPKSIRCATGEAEYRQAVDAFLGRRDDGTLPEKGWPWPWATSSTTDYAYAFDAEAVHCSRFGGAWFSATGPKPEIDDAGKVAVFPDMTARKNMAEPGDVRSGVMLIGRKAR